MEKYLFFLPSEWKISLIFFSESFPYKQLVLIAREKMEHQILIDSGYFRC